MNSKLFIPEKIKVGYQSRSDTYTKKLAYVIYFDEKGVLRKEKSWQSWRDDKIEPIEVENKPYSGFTLNKGILRDGYWGGGHNMVRIFDDRGIEFEITISNLMYILMGNDCNKRVLSGDFVYAWNGTELVLLPTNTEEFKVSTTFTSLKTNKVSMKELQANVGCMFKTKDLQDWVYLGKMEYNEKRFVYHNRQESYRGEYQFFRDKKHIFYNLNTKGYFYENSPTKLAYLVDPIKVHDFEDLLEGYFNSNHFTQVAEIILEVGEDITDRFTKENRHKQIVEGQSTYFKDNKGNYYQASTPSSVQKASTFLGHADWNQQKSLYYHEIPNKDSWNSNYPRYYEEAIAKSRNPDTNEGYTEWNIQNGGIKFNLVKVTLKGVDGRVISQSKNDNLKSYFFVDKAKTIING